MSPKSVRLIKIKRAYEDPSADDGLRVLVDRLWPRGITKERAQIDRWAKELAPSAELRKWFCHDPAKWEDFVERYQDELGCHKKELRELAEQGRTDGLTLVYGSRDETHNQAAVLKAVLDELA